MAWFSILPPQLTVVETLIIRFFLFLGIITIGPWALVLLYDLLLYIVRAIAYEIPLFGGRARGSRRPRAPSLVERPSGRRRTFTIGTTSDSKPIDAGDMFRQRPKLAHAGDESAVEDND